jgi:hypothetical protein
MLRTAAHAFAVAAGLVAPAAQAFDTAPRPAAYTNDATYSDQELVAAGHAFFGQTTGGVALMIENILSRFGRPDAYILGEEGAGALIGGLRYGEGQLNTRMMPGQQVFWQGPSFGWDFGGNGSRVMMLVYNLPSPDALLQRYTGVDGSAYVVGGLSMTVMAADSTYVIPVRTGVGARLGVSLGYLKFTRTPTWNPF